MANRRLMRLQAVAKGFLLAALLTLLLMAVLTVAVWRTDMIDATLTLLNQLLKIAAIALGVRAAVGRGGTRGFVTGAVLALIYMILGYAMYVSLGGGMHSVTTMLGEMLLGAAIGGVCGTILANMKPKRKRR